MQNIVKFGQNSGRFWLNLFVEKENDEKSRITISQDSEHFLPLLNVEFNVTENESKRLVEIGQVYEDALRTMSGISRVHTEEVTDSLDLLRSISAGTHPSGTIRMSRTPSDGVVNRKLELWNHSNVKILGSAVFPRASATHPTFPAMVLSHFS
jgi:choline dehydrogenase-like flavoprotein